MGRRAGLGGTDGTVAGGCTHGTNRGRTRKWGKPAKRAKVANTRAKAKQKGFRWIFAGTTPSPKGERRVQESASS